MKKVLLFSILTLFLITLSAIAYETIIIKYPDGQIWEKVYYKRFGNEVILHYAPKGQTHHNWIRSIVVHAYNDSTFPVNVFTFNNLAKLTQKNPTGSYKYLKLTENDIIAGRCTKDYKGIHSQCEIYRVTRAYKGIVTIHYINKNKDDFWKTYDEWYKIIKEARFLNSYYRNERTLNKSEYFEL